MPAGRPPKYATAEELELVIESYFSECKANDKPPTITGLAYALDMTRQSLCNYESRDEFFDTIKKAKQRVEMFLEESLHNNSVAGTIFNLKNNFGWKDKSEQHITGMLGVGELTDEQLARIASGSG